MLTHAHTHAHRPHGVVWLIARTKVTLLVLKVTKR